jgi:hypothetical protein
LVFDLFDLGAKPRFHFSLEMGLIVLELQVFDGFPVGVQRYAVTGNRLSLVFRADKLEQVTFVTGVGSIRVAVIDAGKGILKDRFV